MGLLLVISLIVIYAISPALSYRLLGDYHENYFLFRQVVHIALGLIVFICAAFYPAEKWERLLPWLVGVSVVSVLLLLSPLAITENGATRWIGVGPLSFQPAELMKFTLVMYLGFLLGNRNQNEITDSNRTFKPALILLGILGFVVAVIQKDLGTMIVIAAILSSMLYFAGIPTRQMALLLGGMAASCGLLIIFFPHRIARFATFLNPEADPTGQGYHVLQSLIGFGSGGLFGQGLGRSNQVYGYLPEAANDSIFAIYGEKFGFIGAVAVLALLGYLLYKIALAARRNERKDYALIILGVFVWFAAHVIVNVGAMLSLMPLTGITLPLLSYGGSSLLFMMLALGVVFQLSRGSARDERRVSPSSAVGAPQHIRHRRSMRSARL